MAAFAAFGDAAAILVRKSKRAACSFIRARPVAPDLFERGCLQDAGIVPVK